MANCGSGEATFAAAVIASSVAGILPVAAATAEAVQAFSERAADLTLRRERHNELRARSRGRGMTTFASRRFAAPALPEANHADENGGPAA
jgi:hypothetical protein